MANVRIALAQLNPRVGDIPGNTQLVIDAVRKAEQDLGADVVLFPELTLMGYPPEDLLLRESVGLRVQRALDRLLAADFRAAVVVGYPQVDSSTEERRVYNAAAVIQDGKISHRYFKQILPNYQVFDDKRYFSSGSESCVFDLGGTKAALLICEDIWEREPLARARQEGAEVALVLNASPYHVGKPAERLAILRERAAESGMALVYLNQVGGQDELVFDGASLAVDPDGTLKMRAPAYQSAIYPLDLRRDADGCHLESPVLEEEEAQLEAMYGALVLGVRDYVHKNGFGGVVLGLSGGIDSALTLAVAVDALGAEHVEAVMMPFRYTSDMSQQDAAEQARTLGVRYSSISIEPIYDAMMAALKEEFAGRPVDKTEENIQARCRGNLLMAISNKKGSLVLTTGNKSEVAVGYSTLYGDMAGGFDVLKDVSKSRVFALSRYRNTLGPCIPERVITRPPTAELAPGQKDEDSLPPYDVLDQILAAYIEQDMSAEQIVAEGFEREQVLQALRMVDINEYKRRQAAIGPRITTRGFGRDRRYPITSGWKIGD
ncbi:NAD+ synthase [Gilvimarinus sp. F26214L]|uniref:NAD+ synthase n=1 Tax=Gilvimarinus sp. DZF01 TaxID=3461371 RepID=UPI004045E6C9